MRIESTVVVSLERLLEFREQLNAQLNGSPGPVHDAVKKWALRARGDLQERFDSFSKGGGDWPALKEATVRQRRGTTASILRDLGFLFAVFNPVFTGAPGALQEEVPFGIRIGFGGGATHPDSPTSIVEIAGFHQVGAGHLPVREMIDELSEPATVLMVQDLRSAIDEL